LPDIVDGTEEAVELLAVADVAEAVLHVRFGHDDHVEWSEI